MFEHVAARVGCASGLKFRPVSPQQIGQAGRLGRRVPVLPSEALNASVVYQPVVLGVAYGHVRLIRGALEVSSVRPSDIVVSEWVPEQIPPVGGLVTSQLQAPLAHVAVLCRNRHTPDMALRGAVDLDMFTRLEGQLVKLSVAAQDCAVERADPAEAQAAWAARRPATAGDPPPTSRCAGCSTWPRSMRQRPRFVGVKAAQMGRLARLEGLTTPGGFAIPFSAYRDHLQASGLDAGIEAMLSDDAFVRDAGVRTMRSAAVRAAIQRHPVRGDVLTAVCERLQSWAPQRRSIFRNSTNAEDPDGFSGAGLYDSIEVSARPTAQQVADALRQVWASVWLERAFEERDWYRIDHGAVAMGVLVQPWVDSAVATGVAITGNPYKPGLDAVFINTQWSGATVTGALGHQMPEQYLAATWTGSIAPKLISGSSLAGGEPTLRDEELADLTAQLLHIHQAMLAGHSGSANAMDVEFALTRAREFVVLQARPYRIVYSLDRADRERSRTGWTQGVQDRLRRLAYRVNRGDFSRRASRGRG
jgi:hypothetical protein